MMLLCPSVSLVETSYLYYIGTVLKNEVFLVTWVASCASAITSDSFLSNSMLGVEF